MDQDERRHHDPPTTARIVPSVRRLRDRQPDDGALAELSALFDRIYGCSRDIPGK
jgi:hypothetical protein